METFDFLSLSISGLLKSTPMAIAIGVFDGVHIGHRAILETLTEDSRRTPGTKSMVISFSRNPKASSEGNLDTLRLRSEYIASFGIDFLAVIDFSTQFSKISACGFADILTSICMPRYAVVGSDFRFGNPSSQADGEELGHMLQERGFECRVDIVQSILSDEGERISSTLLRRMIKEGRLDGYSRYAGQGYRVDLMPLPCRVCDDELVFSTESIHQLLPPLGAYDTVLLMHDGRTVGCRAEIEQEFLVVSSASASSAIGMLQSMGKDDAQLDSLIFGV